MDNEEELNIQDVILDVTNNKQLKEQRELVNSIENVEHLESDLPETLTLAESLLKLTEKKSTLQKEFELKMQEMHVKLYSLKSTVKTVSTADDKKELIILDRINFMRRLMLILISEHPFPSKTDAFNSLQLSEFLIDVKQIKDYE